MSNGLINNLKIIIEIFTFLYCLAELFGKKLKISIHAVVLIIVNLFVIAGIANYRFPEYFHSLCYIAMFLYGLLYYGENVKLTLVNCFLAMVIVSFLPLFLYWPLYFIFHPEYEYVDLYALGVVVGSFLLIILLRHKIKLKNLSDLCIKRNKLILIVTILILCGFGYNFYQIVDKHMLFGGTYFLIIYIVLFFLFIIYEWQKVRIDVEKKKAQLEMNRLYYDAYDQLVMLVRERQHDLKNHINAILSMIYTVEDFDELRTKQTEYCDYVMEQNEKTKLVLSAGNPLLAGFLYSKIREAETYNITIDYKIGIEKKEMAIPEYELVEMVGILLDNAIEALNSVRKKEVTRKIYFSIKDTEDEIDFIVANTSPFYEEDMTDHFFESGYSSKGQNRGIGLSKLKRLVQDRKGDIMVYNELLNGMNYLTFEIKLLK